MQEVPPRSESPSIAAAMSSDLPGRTKRETRVVTQEVRVVVVDDSQDCAESLATYLTLNGYSTRTASDGAGALATVHRFVPHYVLLDVNMPGMNGLELARHMRAQFRRDVVLVAVTGASVQDADAAATFGVVDHYLHKPIDFAELDRVLPPI